MDFTSGKMPNVGRAAVDNPYLPKWARDQAAHYSKYYSPGESGWNHLTRPYLPLNFAGCCGAGASEGDGLPLPSYPKGVELVVSTKDTIVLRDKPSYTTQDKFQLEDGRWMHFNFFTPEDSGYYEEGILLDPQGRIGVKGINDITINTLQSVILNTRSPRLGVYKPLECDDEGLPRHHYVQLTIDIREHLSKIKGQIVVIEKNGGDYTGWMDWPEIKDIFQVDYESPWFHNYPYPDKHLNYLQLKVLKVKQ